MILSAPAVKLADHGKGGGLTFALQTLLERHDALAAQSQQQRETMTAMLEKLERDNEDLAVRNAKLAEDNRNHLLNLEAMDDQIERTDAEIESLTDSLNSTRRENTKLAARLERTERMDDQLEALEQDYAILINELESMKDKDEAAKTEMKDLAVKNAKLDAQNKNHLRNLEAMEEQIERTDAEVKFLTKTLFSAQRHNDRLEGRLEKAEGLDAELEATQLRHTKLQQELKATCNEQRATLARLGRAESSLRYLDQQLQKMENEGQEEGQKNTTETVNSLLGTGPARVVEMGAGAAGPSAKNIVAEPVFIANGDDAPVHANLASARELLSHLANNDMGTGKGALRRRRGQGKKARERLVNVDRIIGSGLSLWNEKARHAPMPSGQMQTPRTVGINQKGPISGWDPPNCPTADITPNERMVHVKMLDLNLLQQSLAE